MTELQQESLRPFSNRGPLDWKSAFKFYGRMVLDFQVLTVYRHMKDFLPQLQGRVIDVGCGNSPYRFLLNSKSTSYIGIDISGSQHFDYQNPGTVLFDGKNIPFPDASFDGLICTEVLEHVEEYQHLINEMERVLVPGGRGIVTIPWSARFHYIPYDYFRYTPSALQTMFQKFPKVTIQERGSDLTSIAAKIVVVFARLRPQFSMKAILGSPIWVASLPLLVLAILVGHISLWWKIGSADDPLGYTVQFAK